MLEVILSLGCYFGTGSACLKAAEGYYYHTGANKVVDDLSQQHRVISLAISTAGAIKDGKATIPLYQQNFIINLNVSHSSNELVFVKSW